MPNGFAFQVVFLDSPVKMPFSLFQDMTVRSCFLHKMERRQRQKKKVSKGDYPQITERLGL
jgi:hypothetical protein